MSRIIKRSLVALLCVCLVLGVASQALAAELRITRQPKNVSVIAGNTAKVTIAAEGDGLKYEWWYSVISGGGNFMSWEKDPNFKGKTYSVTMSAAMDGRKVYCVVRDKHGNSVVSNTVTLTRSGKPSITRQPSGVTVANGQNATVSVRAKGDRLTYQWWYANEGVSTFKKVKGATSNSYSIAMSSKVDGRRLYCEITDVCGVTVRTNTVTLNKAPVPTITRQPQGVTVVKNTYATVNVSANGVGLKYVWWVKNPGEETFTKTTNTSTSYKVKMTATRSGMQVYCKITDTYGQVLQTKTVTLKMAPIPKFTRQPKNVTVLTAQEAKVTVAATGTGLTYKWYVKMPTSTVFTLNSTFNNLKYFAQYMSSTWDGAQVYCKVTDTYGQTAQSKTVTLRKAPPIEITQQPQDATVIKGRTVSTEVTATGEGLKYRWYIKAPGATEFTATAKTTRRYAFTMQPAYDGRQAYCVITDKYGQSVQTNTVTLSMYPLITIDEQRLNWNLSLNTPGSFFISASAGEESLHYAWWIREVGTTEYVESAYTIDVGNLNAYLDDNNQWIATGIRKEDNQAINIDRIYCMVSDDHGQTKKSKVFSIALPKKLEIVEQPQDVFVLCDEEATVSVTVTGGKNVRYRWHGVITGYDEMDFATTRTFTARPSCDEHGENDYYVRCTITDSFGQEVHTAEVGMYAYHPLEIESDLNEIYLGEIGKSISLSFETRYGARVGEKRWYAANPGEDTFTLVKTVPYGVVSPYLVQLTEANSGMRVYAEVTDCVGNTIRSRTATIWAEPDEFHLEVLDNSEVVITGYKGSGDTCVIPATIFGLPVTQIADEAFAHKDFTSLVVNASITSWGNNAFYDCDNLKNVTFNGSISAYGSTMFHDCDGLLTHTVPAGVTSIGRYAFAGCDKLYSVSLPSSLRVIEDGAFSSTTNLGSMVLPEGVQSIGFAAFQSSSLSSITLPSSLRIIDGYAFKESRITSITIPDGVTTVGNYAFFQCKSLKTATWPSGTTTIGDYVFYDCTSLTSVTIPSTVTGIGTWAFGSTALTSISLPSGLSSIGNYAFHSSALTSVTLPASLISLSDYAFSNSNLTSVVIPEGLQEIGTSFKNCSSLQSVTLPRSIIYISSDAFNGCSSNISFNVSVGSYAHSWCSNNNYEFVLQ